MQKRIFVPFSKIDEATRTVYGVMTAEELDKSGEILDYEQSKPYIEKWSQSIFDASGGKSLGNVREMHKSIAAGRLTEIGFDDESKSVPIAAEVVDDASWAKVEKGVLTGFSIGGDYINKWPDPSMKKAKRYVANPIEVSLVDNPCLTSATFVSKAGEASMVKLLGSAAFVKQTWTCGKSATHHHLAKEEAVLCDGDTEPAAQGDAEQLLEKCLYCVADLAQAIAGVDNAALWLQGVSDTAAATADTAIQGLFEALTQLVADIKADRAADEPLEMAAVPGELTKVAELFRKLQKARAAIAPPKISKGDVNTMTTETKKVEEPVAKAAEVPTAPVSPSAASTEATPGNVAEQPVELAKAADPNEERLARLEKGIETLTAVVSGVITNLGNQPAAPRGIRAVAKSMDLGAEGDEPGEGEPEDLHSMMKGAMSKSVPIVFHR